MPGNWGDQLDCWERNIVPFLSDTGLYQFNCPESSLLQFVFLFGDVGKVWVRLRLSRVVKLQYGVYPCFTEIWEAFPYRDIIQVGAHVCVNHLHTGGVSVPQAWINSHIIRQTFEMSPDNEPDCSIVYVFQREFLHYSFYKSFGQQATFLGNAHIRLLLWQSFNLVNCAHRQWFPWQTLACFSAAWGAQVQPLPLHTEIFPDFICWY